jgi:hypothetical protein
VASGFAAIFFIKIFLFQIQITSPNNTQTTMDLLEHQAILGRLQRKHRKAQDEATALRAQVEELKSTPPRPIFCSPPPKPAHGRRIFVGSHCTRLDAGVSAGWACDATSPLINSPASGAVP